MGKYETLQATRDDARSWAARAKAALQAVPDDPIRDILGEIADYVVDRLA
jgi:octaprenyl-diphosphate synthase